MSALDPGSTRFARLEQLFHQALALPPAMRADFLAAACGADAALRTTLQDMLRYAEIDDTGVGADIGTLASELAAPPDRSGERVGPYELSARIRFGGMAEVYAARRADGEFEQEVAIKIVRGDRLQAGMAALFQAERGLLARLRHPNICQFFDGGRTQRGEPYLVMERLHGAPLPQFCREHGLPWRAVLAHLLDLCAALAHIHAQLIVHRDIKPDNVLVASGPTGPVVKLLDFGIASLLSPEGIGVPADNWFSPNYAAPEVVAGQSGGVAVDIYSLGRLLRDLAPLFPADRRRELERIATHAAADAPQARYPSVDALAADLRRVRDRQPISLRPQLAYRAWRYLQRHALALALVAVALGLIAMTLWREVQLRTAAERASALAVQERDKAAAIRDFLLETYAAANPELNDGRDLRVSEMLDQQLAALNDNRSLADTAKIDLLAALGSALTNLGRFERADQAARQALALAQGDLGSARWAQLTVTLAQNAQRMDRFDTAEALFQSVDRRDAAWRQSSDALDTAAWLYSSWAVLAQRQQRLDQAESLIQRALDARRQRDAALARAPTTASLLVTLGAIQSARARLPDALSTFEQAYAENRAHGRSNNLPHLALLGWIGITLDKLGAAERAEPYLKEAVDLAELLFPKPHPKLSGAYGNLGMMYLVNGRLAEAEPLLQRGLDVLKAMGDDRSAVYQSRVQSLGRLALEREDLVRAAPLLAESLRLRRETLGNQHERTAIALLSSTTLSLLSEQPDTALRQAQEALAILRALKVAGNPFFIDALLSCAEAHAARAETTQAQALLAEYQAAVVALPDTHPRQRATWLLQEAHAWRRLGDHARAERSALAAIEAYGGDAHCTHPGCAQAQLLLAAIAAERDARTSARQRLARAEPVLRAALVAEAVSLRRMQDIRARLAKQDA